MSLRPGGMELSDSEDDLVLGTEIENEQSCRTGYVHNWQPRPGYEGGFAQLPKVSTNPPSGPANTRWPTKNQRTSKPPTSTVVIEDLRGAVMKGNMDLVQQYLDQGVPVDSVTSTGWTALMYAASDANLNLVKLLLKKGANFNFIKDGHTPLMVACQCSRGQAEIGIAECAAELVAAGADVNARDWHHQMTPLMMAAKKGYTSVAEMLIKNGAELNRQDKRGWTALCYAVTSGKPRLVQLLLENGADTSIQCSDGQTAADLAHSFGRTQIIEQFKGTSSMPSDRGRTQEATGAASAANATTETTEAAAKFCTQISRSDLEMFLMGLGLSELIPLFHEHDIAFAHLLTLTDIEMQKMGISKVGDRKKLLDAVHDVHKKDWEPSSLPSNSYTKFLTCADMTAIVANIENHFKYITSTLTYMAGQVKERPHLLDPGNDGKGVAVLKHQISQCKLDIQHLSRAAEFLETRMNEALADSTTDAPDVMMHETYQQRDSAQHRRRSLLLVMTTAALAALAASAAFKFGTLGGARRILPIFFTRS